MEVLLFGRIPKDVVNAWIEILKKDTEERIAKNIVLRILGDPRVSTGMKEEIVKDVREVLDEIKFEKVGIDDEDRIKKEMIEELKKRSSKLSIEVQRFWKYNPTELEAFIKSHIGEPVAVGGLGLRDFELKKLEGLEEKILDILKSSELYEKYSKGEITLSEFIEAIEPELRKTGIRRNLLAAMIAYLCRKRLF